MVSDCRNSCRVGPALWTGIYYIFRSIGIPYFDYVTICSVTVCHALLHFFIYICTICITILHLCSMIGYSIFWLCLYSIYVQLYPANCVPTLTLLAIIQTPCTIGITLFSIYLLLINIISIYSLPYWVSYSKVYTLITLLHSESSQSSCREKTYSFESTWLYSSSWFEPGTRFSGGSRKSHSNSGSGLPQKVIKWFRGLFAVALQLN